MTPNLTTILHTLAAALIAFIPTIRANRAVPWPQRTNATARLTQILQQLLALTARINPARIGPTHFARPRPTAPRPTRRPKPARPRRTPSRPLSARQAAIRLAALLQEIQEIANELLHPLPPQIQRLCTQARTEAGCDRALPPSRHPPPQPTPTT